MTVGKRELRMRVLAARAALPQPWRERASRVITETLAALPEFTKATTVLAYASFGSEFDTKQLLHAVVAGGRRLVLPRVQRAPTRLSLHVVTSLEHDLVESAWGIREPDPQRCLELTMDDVDCVLIPGVAFDARGGRLGYGGGFYDRLLAGGGNPGLIAATYSVQCVQAVPMAVHDRRVPIIVTEAATIRIR